MNAGGWKHDSNEHSLRAADRAMGPQRAALQVPSINRCIDPTVAVKKLLRHGAGLFIVQMFVGLVMFAVAILSDMWYGFSVWYTDAGAGGKLHHMQYAWAVFNVLSACWGMKVYIAWQDPTEGTRLAICSSLAIGRGLSACGPLQCCSTASPATLLTESTLSS
jgi:hypothetical protein